MAFESLTEREKQILFNLINYYVQSADPVGSRVIANKFKMGISSATIRNTLADLEELGLVEQPHTSAGRIPTDLGYRVYVDYLLKPEELSQSEKDVIRSTIFKEGRGVNEILGQTCRLLGDITHQLGVTIAPRFDEGRLRRLELIPLTDERIMVVVVVESGMAKSVILEVEAAVDERALRDIEAVLNERLAGLTLGEIRRSVSERLADVRGKGKLVKLLIDSRDKIWTHRTPDDIKIAGLENLVAQPEFASLEKVSELMKLLENDAELSQYLDLDPRAELVITIGKENRFGEVMNCSLVTSSYKVGKVSGTVGIIGPTRMPYSKLVSVIQYTARTISDTLSGMDSEAGQKD
jgi:heat-inducible transcriptional repressor